MALLSPAPFRTKPGIVGAYSISYTITYPDGIVAKGKLSVVFFPNEEDEEEKDGNTVTMDLEAVIPRERELGPKLRAFQENISFCANSAENIKSSLLKLNLLLFANDVDDIKRINSLDFMKLKDNFIEYIKNDSKYKNITTKELRRDFQQFINDRNIYTHGILHLRSPDFDFVIEYIDSKTKLTNYAIVTKEIINSFYATYEALEHMIGDFYKLRNQ